MHTVPSPYNVPEPMLVTEMTSVPWHTLHVDYFHIVNGAYSRIVDIEVTYSTKGIDLIRCGAHMVTATRWYLTMATVQLPREEQLDYYIILPAASSPNPFLVVPVANIHPVIARLVRRVRWLLARLADMFIEPPGLQHTRSGRTVQAPGRCVVPMFRQEGDSQVEDRRWYQ